MAKLDRSALDKARSLNNLPPLTDAAFLGLQGNDDLSEEDALAKAELERKKAEEEAEAKRLADLEKAKNQPAELSDEQLLEILSKKTGRTIGSFKDLVPTEVIDAEKAAEERENEKFAWGLQTKKIKQKDVENFIAASKDPRSIVYQQKLAQARKEDKDLDEKEFEAEFNDYYALDAEKGSRRYKNGQETLNLLAEKILQKNYASIYNLENEYAGHEKTQTSQKAKQDKILAATPAYNATLNKVFAGLKKIKAQFSDDESFEVDGFDDSLNAIRQSMSTPDFVSKQILDGATEEELQEIAYTTLVRKEFPVLAKQIAVQYLRKHAAGTKGILTLKNPNGEIDETQLTDEQKKLKQIIADGKPEPAVAN